MPIPTYKLKLALTRRKQVGRHSTAASDGYIPKDVFEDLPAQPPESTARSSGLRKHSDYRFGSLRIDWIDLNEDAPISSSPVMRTFISGKDKEERGRTTSSATFVPRPHQAGSTNLPEGIVHIYRSSASQPTSSSVEASAAHSDEPAPDWDGVTLAVLAVPAWMTPADFLAFVAPAADGIKHIRIIRDSLPNRAIAILRFRTTEAADEFAEAYNGQAFSSIETETVHIVRISAISISTDDATSQTLSRLDEEDTEMPTCPVCLERMDASATGLVTVPCAHTFHCTCLSKWGDSRCPVCRYSQNLLSSSSGTSSNPSTSSAFPSLQSSSSTHSSCADCASPSNLWICLVCGNVGCGRYGRAHAVSHYTATAHVYALELETQRVWDYAGDGYVHRLIQNKADGKLVELPSAGMGGEGDEGGGKGPSKKDALSAEKIEAIGMEYSTLLISQLDSQREWYEERTAALQAEMAALRALVERLDKARLDDDERRVAEADERRREDAERYAVAERERTRAEQRAKLSSELARRFERELKEERAVSAGLLKNLSATKASVSAAEDARKAALAEVGDLQEQVRDVMFALELKNKIEEGGGMMGEVEGGSVVVPQPTPGAQGKTKKKGKK